MELLRERARDQTDDTAFVFLKDGEVEEMSLTYGELETRARAVAAHLQQRACPGERALLLFPAGLDYICAFFGCLFAGVIAVPIYPPQSQRSRVGRLQSVIADSGASWLLAGSEILASLQADTAFESLMADLQYVATDTLSIELASHWNAPDVDRSTVAFLQYTSGSTGTAKGVVVSHGNLLCNEALIRDGFANHPSDLVVGWLPLYHDMGLVGNVLQPIYLGATAVLMSPMAFLQKPIRWLEAISRYRGTVSGGPNFAYELCAERVTDEQLQGLDLSSWRVAFNGSEPIRATTLQRFASAFASVGFRDTALFPCYGLAESTLFVSGAEPSSVPVYLDVDPVALQRHVVALPTADASRRLVGSGRADPSRLHIVAPADGRRCGADEVGEIWIRGASVAQGYWQRPQITTEMFKAYTSDGSGPFLRTGDYGFVREGELFVTGRLKELVIIRGRNHYPQDIEQTVQASHPSLTIGAGAAFSVDVDGEERLVVVQEVQRTHLRRLDVAEVVRAVRIAVGEQHELQLHALALIKPMRLPKTSSGKIKRREARSLYLDGQLDLLGQPSPTASATVPATVAAVPVAPLDRNILFALPGVERGALLEAYLQHLLADLLRVPVVSVDMGEALTAQGLDSLAAIQLQHRLDSDAGLDCPIELLLAGPSPRELAGRLAETMLQPSVVPSSGSTRGPLSWNQESMWFLQSMAPQSSAYNLAVPLRILSLLSGSRLEQAWTLLAQRHPMLHTHFDGRSEALFQQIDAAAAPAIEWVDVADWSDDRLQDAMLQAVRRSLLGDGIAPVQVQVYRRGPDDHILLLLAHHIAVDLQTLVLLLRQLGEIYTGLGEGKTLQPATISHTTIDFALWQRTLVASEAGERQWNYWREQLAGELPVLTLPTDRPRPRLRDNVGAAVDFVLDTELSDRLRTLARTQGVTLYMLLLASYQLFLHKYNGDEAVCVGSPVSGRRCAAFDSLAGYCVNTVVLRADLGGNPRFDDLLAQVRDRVLGALANQDLPFACLVERLVPQRDPAITPLFQTLFSLQQIPELPTASAFVLGQPGARVELGDLLVESVALPPQTCQFDLSLFVADGENGLRARFEYAASLFDPARIEDMAQHFCRLLEGIVAAPHAPLSQLPLLSRPLALGLLRRCNGTPEAPKRESLVQLVSQQAIAMPDGAALICGDRRLSYAELERAAESLAQTLRAYGIGPGDRVGLCLPRDTRVFVSLLAVLKTGAAYVPLDPAYPVTRLRTIMTLARLRLVMLEDAAAGSVLPGDVPALRLGPDGSSVITDAGENLETAANARAEPLAAWRDDPTLPVYLIYTSGSTGTPKGVAMNQGALCNLLRWHQQAMPLAPGSRVSQFASINFDVSFQEIFSTWIAGATLVVAADEHRHDPEALLHLLHRQQVQRAFLPVVVLQQLAQQAITSGQLPGALRQVICAGEALLLNAAVRRLFLALPEAQLYNHYGPTESHVVTSHCLQGDPGLWPSAPPIGRPIGNASIYLLDAYGHPVPFGATGELCIAGACLADGYFDRGDLTAERFAPDPFVEDGAARMYRTGDLGRYLPDGSIEYLGRRDFQVQLRGFRIELGEIEAQLCALDGVGEAAVMLREDQPGSPCLAGYLVAAPGATADLAAWRDALRGSLPDYMIPAQLMLLDALPLTANGKVDVRALPTPDANHVTAGYVAPLGATERRVAQLWSEALGVERVGRHDHFFEHGGHSLLATKLVARLRLAFAVQLPVSALFETPTVAGLAAHIDAAPAIEAPPLQPVSRALSLPLSHAQQRLWFIEQMDGASATYNMPAAFRLEGQLDVTALRGALQRIVQRHEILRTYFTEGDQQPIQQIDDSVVLDVPVFDVAESDVAERLRKHAQSPFQLREAPLFRATVLRTPAQHVLLVNMHHIVCDGWSIGVLVRELTEFYSATIEQREPVLAALAVQYGDYAHWQRRWVDATVSSQLAYWRDQLDGLPPLLELPGDRPRPPVQSYRGGLHRFVLPHSLGAALASFSKKHGATVFMTLMATFQVLLARHSGQTDIAVGTPVANRERPELENLIGFFVNTVIVRGRLERAGSFLELLAQIRETTIAAQRHQDVPFEQLVEELKPTRSLSHSPLFQVMFLQHDGALDGLRLPGLTLHGEDQGHTIARFDLALNVEQRSDGLHAWFDYAADLFDADRVARLAIHYQQLLASVLQDAACHWSRLPMLATNEIAAQIVPQRALAEALAPTLCMPRLFEAQVDRAPEAPAAVFEEQSLSYGELDRRANQLAHYLREQGVQTEEHVGVWMERSPELLVAIMALWKVGAVYVPLDPGYPSERLDYIVEDAGVRCMLTQSSLGDVLQAPAAQALCMDRLERDIAACASTRPVSSTHGLQPAYVIYTSGSTGKPKGVQVLQTGLCELLLGLCHRFDLGPRDSMPSLASHAFGISFVELLLPLVVGGHTRILGREAVLDTERLACELSRVTRAHLVPSLMRRVLDHLDEAGSVPDFASLRHVFVGGDAVAPVLLTEMEKRFTAAEVVEFYGQTETTILSCHAPQDGQVHAGNVIGKRLPHAQAYVLDEDLQLLAQGSVGQIHIGGHGVARGYLGRPEQTAERFVPDPFGAVPGARLYRSGDLGRLLTDGSIEYVGRSDFQVNIRGFRIELGEIEAVLRAEPVISGVVVTAGEDERGERRLIAYVVPEAGEEISVSALRNRLRASLPDYMMPSQFVLLEAFPLNPNGKLDRRALPAPDPTALVAGYVEPRDELERELADLWAGVLGLPRVGIHDNFFDLGGHSLLAAQAMARARQQLGTEISVQDFFEAQTVAEFAIRVRAVRHNQKLLAQLTAASEDDSDEFEDYVI